MSDLESSFLQQIARQPHDWLPRLILADWLEEQGDPRAELIRLSHQLTRLDSAQRQQKKARAQRQLKEDRLQELSAAGVIWPSPSLPNSLNLPLVLIPPGQFRMGSPKSEPGRQKAENQVEVTLTQGFWLGQSAVTQSEYEAVMGRNPSYFNREQLQADSSRHPVEQVSWDDAMEFCRKLTGQERAAVRLPSDWEYTLPTEAQWEYACRAGTTTATAFGNSLSSADANFNGNHPYNGAPIGESKAQTTAVCNYRTNAWNLYDMHGNVWDWCRDRYAEQLPGGTDPIALDKSTYRVFRGGSWNYVGGCSRSAYRLWSVPGNRTNHVGFRLAAVQIHPSDERSP